VAEKLKGLNAFVRRIPTEWHRRLLAPHVLDSARTDNTQQTHRFVNPYVIRYPYKEISLRRGGSK